MKKQFCAALLGAALALALAGCGGSQPQSGSAAASSAIPAPASSAAGQPASGSEAEAPAGQSFFGVWEVTPNVEFGEVSALSAEDAQQYIGAQLEYRADAVLCNGETVASGTLHYTAAPYDEAKLVEEFRVNLGEWWNAIGEVTFVEAEPAAGVFGGQFFVADDHTLWLYHEGAFFLARPAE